MDDNNWTQNLIWVSVGSAVMFGAGVLSSHLFRKAFRTSPESFDTLKKATRMAAARARGRNHKMVFVVRTDLNMGKGKIAAQCCHAAVMCYQKAKIMDPENLELWEATGTAKVCLKATGDGDYLKVMQKKAKDIKLVTAIVCDAGHTQVNALICPTFLCLHFYEKIERNSAYAFDFMNKVDPGTYTVLGIGPAPVSEIDRITGHLKLL